MYRDEVAGLGKETVNRRPAALQERRGESSAFMAGVKGALEGHLVIPCLRVVVV
jgi:hypothetical protein